MISITKICSACGEEKPITEFKKRKESPDGHRGKCKTCRAPGERAKKLRYLSNPINYEKVRAYGKKNRIDNLEKRKAYDKQHYWDNRDREIAESKRWREENRERHLAYHKNYHIKNKDKEKQYAKDHKDSILEYQKKWISNNREKIRAYGRKRYWKDVDKSREINKTEKSKARHREKYKKNREKKLAQNRKWRENNKDRFIETSIKWVKNNPQKITAYRQNRRAKVLGNGGSFTPKEWKSLCDKFGNICLCCKKSIKLEADHVVPLAKGGSNFIDNIQPLCRICNAKKHTKIIDYR